MTLDPDDSDDFFRLYLGMLFFANQQLHVIPHSAETPDTFDVTSNDLVIIRDALLDRPDLLGAYIDRNPFELTTEELDVVRSWEHRLAGDYYIFRELKRYTVFLSSTEPTVAYGVLAITDPFRILTRQPFPILVQTVLLPFRGKIVCDGLLVFREVFFGDGIRLFLNESFRTAKRRLGIVTSLPIASRPASKARTPSTSKPRARAEPKPRTADEGDVVGELVERFCLETLNDEYAGPRKSAKERAAERKKQRG